MQLHNHSSRFLKVFKRHMSKTRTKKQKTQIKKINFIFPYQDIAIAKALVLVILDCGMNCELGILELFFKYNI